MKKLLTATTALALVGGAAFAEITISGSAELALDYNSEADDGMSKHTFNHDFNVNFAGSGTTDGGLSFGASGGLDNESGGNSSLSEGTVFVSGAFGTITFGDNGSADKLSGGIADVGLNDVGVDDVAEDLYGTTANQVRYDQTVGNIALAISAGTNTASAATTTAAEVKKNDYAIGMSFNASGATVGLGYDSKKAISAGFGYSTGQISANAFYAKRDMDLANLGPDGTADNADDTTNTVGQTGLGLDVSYTMGASTLTLAYAKTDLKNIQAFGDGTNLTYVSASLKGMGVGFSHDLGGGAKLVAGFAQVPMVLPGDDGFGAMIGYVTDGPDDDTDVGIDDRRVFGDKNVASIGLSFSF